MPRLPGQSPFVITALAALTLSLAACDNSNDAASDGSEQAAPTDQTSDGGKAGADPTSAAGDQAGTATDGTRSVPDKLKHHTETMERRPEGCDGDGCPVFEVSLQVYEGQPALNQAVRDRLTSQLVVGGEDPATPDSLEDAARQFLATAASTAGEDGPGWELSGSSKQIGRWQNLVTVAINSYEFTGGAHGMPITQWLNWDLAANRPVSLGNLIETGQEDAFWRAARRAHEGWLSEDAPDDDTFQEDWPFQQTDSFRLTGKGVVLHYDVYSIAPYSMGQPEFTLPWDQLEGVIRPTYRPD